MALLAIATLATLAGCARRYTIREGLWELEFSELQKIYTDPKIPAENMTRPADKVEVLLDYNGNVETIEIYLYETNLTYDAPERDDLREDPLTGTITGGSKIRLDGTDAKWQFVMSGQVKSDVKASGQVYGRPLALEDARAQGTWTLRKLKEPGN